MAHEKHVPATALQTQHQHAASTNKALLASVNHGSPTIAATSKPGEFAGKGVVPAKAGNAAVPATLAKPSVAPAGVAPAGAAPAGAAALEKKQPIGTVHPAATTAGPPKPGHAHSKPLATESHTQGGGRKTTPAAPNCGRETGATSRHCRAACRGGASRRRPGRPPAAATGSAQTCSGETPAAQEAASALTGKHVGSSSPLLGRDVLDGMADQSLRPCTQCSSICSAIARSSSDALLIALL